LDDDVEAINKVPVLLDTSPLVTLCVFKIANRPLIFSFLEHAEIHITEAVNHEVTVQYEKSDARIAKSLVASGRIAVVPAPKTPPILDFYKLHETDCGVIRLGIASPHLITVIDDKEAYIVSTRYGLRPMLLLDLLVLLVQRHGLEKLVALDMVKSAERRYSPSYVAHTIFKLKEVAD
jgi:hypothetical protein